MTPEEEKLEQELEALEVKAGGVFAIATIEGHKKRWERKNKLLLGEIAAAETLEEKERLEQKRVELKQKELKLAQKLGQLTSHPMQNGT